MNATKTFIKIALFIFIVMLCLFLSPSTWFAAQPILQTGPIGVTGSNGTNGTNGINGIDGINGTNGKNGHDGLDGMSFNWVIEGATQIIFRNVSCAKNQRITSLDATVENNSVAYLDLICEDI